MPMQLDRAPRPTGSPASRLWPRFLPIALVAMAIATVVLLRLDRFVSLDQLRASRGDLAMFVAAMPAHAVLLFVATYAAASALSMPGIVVLTLVGGYLFGLWLGAAAVVVGATAGATLLFLAARTAFGDLLRSRAGVWLTRMEASFRKNAFGYLLSLRLAPAIPFFVVNLMLALAGVPLRTFVVTTAIGIIPSTIVFASTGAGLRTVLDSGMELTLQGTVTPGLIAGLTGLSLLPLLPVLARRLMSSTKSDPA